MLHTSPAMRQRVGDLLVRKLTRGQFHWWSPDHWEVLALMKHVLNFQGARWVPQLLKYATKLLKEMEEGEAAEARGRKVVGSSPTAESGSFHRAGNHSHILMSAGSEDVSIAMATGS